MREVRAAAAALMVAGCALLTAGCGSSGKHTQTHIIGTGTASSSKAAFRKTETINQCLTGNGLQVLSSPPPAGTSILYAPKAGKVTVLRIPKYAASVWVYPSHKIQEPFFVQSSQQLKELGYANVIVVYAGNGQPSAAIEHLIDPCAFGAYVGQAYASPLIEVS